MAVYALVEPILVARGAILYLVLEQKVEGVVLDPAVQLAFVVRRHWNGMGWI